MLRTVHCIYDDPKNPWVGGGGAMRVFEIYRRLAGRVDATVITGNFPNARDEAIDGVHYRRLGARSPYPWSRWSYARAATDYLSRAEYDVALFDFSAYTPIRIPPHRPVGLVVHMLHGPTAVRRWGRIGGRVVRRTERRMLRRARWISTTSRWMLCQLEPLIVPGTHIRIVGSGVPDEFARVERHEENYLLYYGRFDLFQKGLDTLLEAFSQVVRRHPELELRIAGRGKDAGRIIRLARELKIEQRVRILSDVDRNTVLSLFAGALALVMPSRLEGLPMVPAEAMAAGVPVIATSAGAVPEVVAPPEGGILISPDDPAALADAVLALVEDPARRVALSRSARRSAARFSWDTVAEQHLGFLEEIAGRRGGAGPWPVDMNR